MLFRLLGILAAFTIALAAPGGAGAQDFPSRPVRIIAPFAAGTGPDVVTRVLAEELSSLWGQPVTVDNRQGAGGILAMQELKNAPADGHTLALGDVGTLALNPHVYAKLPYDPERDLAIVTDLFTVPWVFMVPKNGPIKSFEDFVAAARKKPGALTYASYGPGSPNSVVFELLKRKLNIDLLEVPHRSGTDMLIAVSTGRIDSLAGSLASIDAYKDRIMPIAIASDDREMAGSIPSLSSLSGIPGFEMLGWAVVVARKEVPSSAINKLRASIKVAFSKAALRERMAKLGMKPGASMELSALEAMIKADAERYGEVIKASKIPKQ